MVTEINHILRQCWRYAAFILKWTGISLFAGLLCGAVGAAFHHAVDWAGGQFAAYGWLLYCLPLSGLLIVFFYRLAGVKNDLGTNRVLASLEDGSCVPFRIAALIFTGTVLTHACGGSAGKEGAALQIGAALIGPFGRVLHLSERERKTLTACGMAGLFSAVFGTPVTAAVFSLEVCMVGQMRYTALYPCLVSSVAALTVSRAAAVASLSFSLKVLPAVTLPIVLQITALTILCALVSILFLTVMHVVQHQYEKHIVNPYLRVVIGGLLVIALTLLLGSRDYNGAGLQVIYRAMEGEAAPYAFLLKILFTAITIGAGFKGGEIVPTFFIGATFGCAAGPLLGLDAGFSAAIGLIALFCSVVNCPIASIVMAIELFGREGLVIFSLVCALSYLISGKYSLYAQQVILFDKLDGQKG